MTDTHDPLVLEGRLSNLLAVNLVAAIAGTGMLYLLSLTSNRGRLFMYFTLPVLLLWLFGDALWWHLRGVHALYITPLAITTVRGRSGENETFMAAELTAINVRTRLNRKTVQLQFGDTPRSIPGVFTWYPGRRIHLTSDAFNDCEFDAALQLLRDIAPPACQISGLQ